MVKWGLEGRRRRCWLRMVWAAEGGSDSVWIVLGRCARNKTDCARTDMKSEIRTASRRRCGARLAARTCSVCLSVEEREKRGRTLSGSERRLPESGAEAKDAGGEHGGRARDEHFVVVVVGDSEELARPCRELGRTRL